MYLTYCCNQDKVFFLVIIVIRAQFDLYCSFELNTDKVMGTAVAQWLRCCATNQKVAGSVPAGVIGIFH